MTQLRPRGRRGVLSLTLAAVVVGAVSLLGAGPASAQAVDCPAGARGGAGGDAGRSVGGSGGLGFTVGGFSTSGSANADGGEGGSARGGSGGRGGSGTLPICNQNTNGAVRSAARTVPSAARPAAPARTVTGTGGGTVGTGGGRGGGYGGGLARTGSSANMEIGLAGLAFIAGGFLLFFGQPLRRARTRA